MELTQTLRLVARRLRRSPSFTATAVLTLAVGIGATAAVFSVVHGVLLSPLSFEEPDRLVGLWHSAPGLGFEQLNQSPALHYTYLEDNRSFDGVGLWDNDRVTVTGSAAGKGTPEELRVIRVTDGTLPLLGVQPVVGRLFDAEDDSPGGPRSVILSHGFWRQRFGGDDEVVGRSLTIDGVPYDVIGVLPAELQFLDHDPAIYLPFRFDRSELFFGNFSFQGVARLADGVTLEQASADVDRMIPLSLERFPLPPGFSRAMFEDAGLGANLHPLSEEVIGDVGRVLWLLLGTVGLVLLVACANVANLLLVRAEGRYQELAVRSALGADRRRLTLDMLVESLVLGLLGGAGGLGLAAGALALLQALEPAGLPRLDEISLDGPVVLFTLAVSVVTPVLFGLLPAARMGIDDLVAGLKDESRGGTVGRRGRRARDILVAAQVALALVLMVGSGLMVRSFLALQAVEPGFEAPETVQTLRIPVPPAEVEDPAEVARLQRRILDGLARLPGVESASLTSSVTMDGWDSNDPVFVEDFPGEEGTLPPIRRYKWVAPGYFRTLGNPILAGRDLTWEDIEELRPVAVVSRDLAAEYWSDPAQALGRRIQNRPNGAWREIVGVVGEIRDDGVDQDPVPTVFWPLAVEDLWEEGTFVPRSAAFVLRTPRAGTSTLLDEARQAVWAVNPRLPLARVATLSEILDESMGRTSFALVMLAIAAATALLLGGVGIYGVTSYVVAQRSREIGVRMALGARRREVRRMVLAHGLRLAAAGAAVGLAAAFLLTRLMAALLYGVEPLDPATFAGAALGAGLLALTASWFPARRAARVDPAKSLY